MAVPDITGFRDRMLGTGGTSERVLPRALYSPAERQFIIGGRTIPQDDITTLYTQGPALAARGMPGRAPEGYEEVDPTQFVSGYLHGRRPDQGVGQAFGAGLRRGGNITQLLGGSLLDALGLDVGGEIADEAAKRLGYESIYAQRIADIEGLGDVPEYVVGMLAEQAPLLLAQAATGGIAGAGLRVAAGVAGGGARLARLGGGVARLAGNPAFGRAVQEAARKKLAGNVLTPAEHQLIQRGAGVAGAGLGYGLASYGMGVGDIWSEMRESDVDDGPFARAAAFVGGLPYAAFDVLPEAAALRMFFRSAPASRLRGAGRGALAGAGTGAFSEAGQEAVVGGASGAVGGPGLAGQSLEQYGEAAGAGAVLGTLLGIAGGALATPRGVREEPAAIPEAAPPAAPEPQVASEVDEAARLQDLITAFTPPQPEGVGPWSAGRTDPTDPRPRPRRPVPADILAWGAMTPGPWSPDVGVTGPPGPVPEDILAWAPPEDGQGAPVEAASPPEAAVAPPAPTRPVEEGPPPIDAYVPTPPELVEDDGAALGLELPPTPAAPPPAPVKKKRAAKKKAKAKPAGPDPFEEVRAMQAALIAGADAPPIEAPPADPEAVAAAEQDQAEDVAAQTKEDRDMLDEIEGMFGGPRHARGLQGNLGAMREQARTAPTEAHVQADERAGRSIALLVRSIRAGDQNAPRAREMLHSAPIQRMLQGDGVRDVLRRDLGERGALPVFADPDGRIALFTDPDSLGARREAERAGAGTVRKLQEAAEQAAGAAPAKKKRAAREHTTATRADRMAAVARDRPKLVGIVRQMTEQWAQATLAVRQAYNRWLSGDPVKRPSADQIKAYLRGNPKKRAKKPPPSEVVDWLDAQTATAAEAGRRDLGRATEGAAAREVGRHADRVAGDLKRVEGEMPASLRQVYDDWTEQVTFAREEGTAPPAPSTRLAEWARTQGVDVAADRFERTDDEAAADRGRESWTTLSPGARWEHVYDTMLNDADRTRWEQIVSLADTMGDPDTIPSPEQFVASLPETHPGKREKPYRKQVQDFIEHGRPLSQSPDVLEGMPRSTRERSPEEVQAEARRREEGEQARIRNETRWNESRGVLPAYADMPQHVRDLYDQTTDSLPEDVVRSPAVASSTPPGMVWDWLRGRVAPRWDWVEAIAPALASDWQAHVSASVAKGENVLAPADFLYDYFRTRMRRDLLGDVQDVDALQDSIRRIMAEDLRETEAGVEVADERRPAQPGLLDEGTPERTVRTVRETPSARSAKDLWTVSARIADRIYGAIVAARRRVHAGAEGTSLDETVSSPVNSYLLDLRQRRRAWRAQRDGKRPPLYGEDTPVLGSKARRARAARTRPPKELRGARRNVAGKVEQMPRSLDEMYADTIMQSLPEGYTKEDLRKALGLETLPRELADVVDSKTATVDDLISAIAQWGPRHGRYPKVEGGMTSGKGMKVGAVESVVRKAKAAMARPPKVIVATNYTALKARHPDLVARIEAVDPGYGATVARSRSHGAAFGDTVILYTDHLQTEAQARLVLAHEALGHYGMRSVLPAKELDAELNRIDKADQAVRKAVDRRMELLEAAGETPSRTEQIEEVLADQAAVIDTSVIRRLWDMLKNALNRMGLKLSDDAARSLIWQARRHVKSDAPTPFRLFDPVDAVAQMEDGALAVRHSRDVDSRVAQEVLFAAGEAGAKREVPGKKALDLIAKIINPTSTGMSSDYYKFKEKVLAWVQTVDKQSAKSDGWSEVYGLDDQQSSDTARFNSPINKILDEHVVKASREDRVEAFRWMHYDALNRSQEAAAFLAKQKDSIATLGENGEYAINIDAFGAAESFGRHDQPPGVPPDQVSDIAEAEKANAAEIDAIMGMGDITWKDKTGHTHRRKNTLSRRQAQIVMGARMVREQAVRGRLVAEVDAVNVKRKDVFDELDPRRNDGWSEKDPAAQAKEIEAAEQAARFLDAVAQWRAGTRYRSYDGRRSPDPVTDRDAVRQARKDYRDLVKAIVDWDLPTIQRIMGTDVKYARVTLDEDTVKATVSRLAKLDHDVRVASARAEQTLAGAYLHFGRAGTEKVRMIAVDSQGHEVALSDEWRGVVPFWAFETRREAEPWAEKAVEAMNAGGKMTVQDEAGEDVSVTWKAKVETSGERSPPNEAGSWGGLMAMLDQAGIEIDSGAREKLTNLYAKETSLKGSMLERAGNPGWDENGQRAITQWAEAQSYQAARAGVSHKYNAIFRDTTRWTGSREKLASLEAKVDGARNAAERRAAERRADRYAYQMLYMHSGEFRYKGKTIKGRGQGMMLRDHALRSHEQLRQMGEGGDVGALFDRGFIGQLRMMTTVMLLGLSPASAALNMQAPLTFSIPWLATYNAETGTGGGYGWQASSAETIKAMSATKHWKLGEDTAFRWDKGGRQFATRFGYSQEVVDVLHEESVGGILQAAQAQSLMESNRPGIVTSSGALKWTAEKAMGAFNWTEQWSRRSVMLAAVSLEEARWKAAYRDGMDVKTRERMSEAMRSVGRAAVTQTLGEYGTHNRSLLERHPVLQLPLMFKHFPLTVLQALVDMPRSAQAMVLGLVLLTSGIEELPFAKDAMDLVNSAGFALGINKRTIQQAWTEALDDFMPGAGELAMHGVFNALFGATISTRTGFGNILPLSSAFLPGASPAREMQDALGAPYSAMLGLLQAGGALAIEGMEIAGLRDATQPGVNVLLDSPVTVLRNLGHAWTILDTGMVLDRKGRVVEDNAPAAWAAMRMMGFTPWRTTHATQKVQWQRVMEAAVRDLRARYTQAAAGALVKGDRAKYREVLQMVRDHNRAVRRNGWPAPWRIANFSTGARRAYRTARNPRLVRAAEAGSKRSEQYFKDLFGLDF